MSALDDFIKSRLPASLLSQILRLAESRPREGQARMRSPISQAGVSLPEDGSFEARAGKGPLSSAFTLYDNGTALLSSPGGCALHGPLLLSESPSSAIRFSYGDVSLNPFWEQGVAASVSDAQAQVLVSIVLPDGTPAAVPLGTLLTTQPLFVSRTPSPGISVLEDLFAAANS